MKPSSLWFTLLLGSLAMVMPFTFDAMLPGFSAIGRDLRADPITLQQILSAYLIGMSCMSLFHGLLSDSYGRRPVILAALCVYLLATLGCALAPDIHVLIVLRALQGLSAGAGMVVTRAVVRDLHDGPVAQRMLATLAMIYPLGTAVAPILGGWLQQAFGWRSIFYFLAGYSLVLLLVSARFLKETLAAGRRQPFRPDAIARNYLALVREPRLILLSLVVALAFGGQFMYIGSAPQFVEKLLGLPSTQFAWVFIPHVAGLVSGSFASNRLAGRLPQATLMRVGFALLFAAALCNVAGNLLFAARVPWAVLHIAVFGFGVALLVPSLQLAAMNLRPQVSGLIASFMTFAQMLVLGLVSGFAVPLLYDSALKLALGMLGAAVLCALCWQGYRAAVRPR